MFTLDFDSRLSTWAKFRKKLETDDSPLQSVIDFWSYAPIIGHTRVLDPYYISSWPNPWEILNENRYDDFTKAVMIGYTLLLTERYKNSKIEVRTLVDNNKNRLYNSIYLDDKWVLNFQDNFVISVDNVPETCNLENLIELKRP